MIIRRNKLKNNISYNYQYNDIGEIVRQDKTFSPTTHCKEIKEYFDENIYDYVIITNNNKYYGIVSIKSLLNYTTMLECNYYFPYKYFS